MNRFVKEYGNLSKLQKKKVTKINWKKSILLDQVPKRKSIIQGYGRNSSNQYSFPKLFVLERDSPVVTVDVICQGTNFHVKRHSNDVSRFQFCTVGWPWWVAIVPGFSIVYCPAWGCVAEGLS